jgi:hypothetical protein
VSDVVDVTITETKSVPGNYTGTPCTGKKAMSEDGRVFTQHWESFPEDDWNPSRYWFDEQTQHYEDAAQCRYALYINKAGERMGVHD